MRPRTIVGFFNEITEPIPFDFTLRDGAAQFYFPVAKADNLPIATPGTALDVYFLPDVKGIRPKNRNGHFTHGHSPFIFSPGCRSDNIPSPAEAAIDNDT